MITFVSFGDSADHLQNTGFLFRLDIRFNYVHCGIGIYSFIPWQKTSHIELLSIVVFNVAMGLQAFCTGMLEISHLQLMHMNVACVLIPTHAMLGRLHICAQTKFAVHMMNVFTEWCAAFMPALDLRILKLTGHDLSSWWRLLTRLQNRLLAMNYINDGEDDKLYIAHRSFLYSNLTLPAVFCMFSSINKKGIEWTDRTILGGQVCRECQKNSSFIKGGVGPHAALHPLFAI